VWEVDASAAGARVDVGSAPSCAWQVVAPHVSPKHVEMYWDGEVLWVARAQGAAEVRVDGIIVDDWYATMQGSTIQMGGASLRVELGASLDTSGLASRTDDHALPPAQKTAFATPAHLAQDRQTIPEAPTTVAGGPAPSPFHGAATQILVPRGGPGSHHEDESQAAASRIAMFEAQARAQRDTQLVEAPLPQGQATQLVSLPDAPRGGPPPPPPGRPPPPQIGASAQNVARATPAPPPSAGRAPAPVTDPAVELPSIIVSPSPSDAAPAGGPQFAAPPPDTDVRLKKEKKQMALPPRTWALLVVTVLAASGLILMDSGEEEVVAPPPVVPTEAEGEVAPTTDEGPDETPVDANEPPLTEEEALSLPREAADALAANRPMEAYRLYRRLAAANPNDETYRSITRILRRRLEAQCRDGVDLAGHPCEVPE
jgi:hypothetical protein